MTFQKRRILYADSDRESRLLMQDLLAPHEVDIADTDHSARVLARRNSYDVYVICGGAPGSTALTLCAWLNRVDPRTPIIFCSSNASAQYQKLAIAAGALRYQVKPVDPRLLRSTIGLLLKLAELESHRALSAEQDAIEEELTLRARRLKSEVTAAQEKARSAMDAMLRVKAYRAFRDAGGNRANFERMWPTLYPTAAARRM